jgi:hypothetical protein
MLGNAQKRNQPTGLLTLVPSGWRSHKAANFLIGTPRRIYHCRCAIAGKGNADCLEHQEAKATKVAADRLFDFRYHDLLQSLVFHLAQLLTVLSSGADV